MAPRPLRGRRASRRELFWSKCIFLECGLDFGPKTRGGDSSPMAGIVPQTTKMYVFLKRGRAVFLRNHSIWCETAVPDAIWLQKPWISLRFLSPQPKGGHSFPEDIYQKSLVSLVFCDDSPHHPVCPSHTDRCPSDTGR